MKKTYLKPQIDVVAIQARGIICTSGLSMGEDTSTAGVTDADSREFDWFDE